MPASNTELAFTVKCFINQDECFVVKQQHWFFCEDGAFTAELKKPYFCALKPEG